jgi:hypothetical protein
MYQQINSSFAGAEVSTIKRIADNAYIPFDPANTDYQKYLEWLEAGNEPTPADFPSELPQFEKDQLRYQRRAAAKDGLIAWMAADNMARVRDGVWTVADLQVLLVELGAVNAMMQTLAFELAAQAISASTNPLLTPDIKANWVGNLTEHFYIN